MPQSLGPFEFGADRQKLDARMRRLLPTAKVIFAREQEGYDALVNTYSLNNVRLATDLVLGNKGINLDHVFRVCPFMELPEIEQDSVAVIPNSMNANISGLETVVAMYAEVVAKLLMLNKTVYLLSHSTMDAALCRTLKAHFQENDAVILLDQDFSCLEFNELVQKFHYLVASRFHSIVHAYKNGIPCIALGWATKYHDLLKLFGQEAYVFDVRNQVSTAAILEAIERMDNSYAAEAAKIRKGLDAVHQENVFDVISER
jgi:colanic acid/amylovoran biosynthesis protein